METLATLVVGLRDSSRIKTKMSGVGVSIDILMTASIVDRLSLLVWMNSEDGQKGVNRPESMVDKLTGKTKERDLIAFDTAEAFDEMRRRLFEGV